MYNVSRYHRLMYVPVVSRIAVSIETLSDKQGIKMVSLWVLLSMAVFLTTNAVADILLHSGQPYPALQPHLMSQPFTDLSHISEKQEAEQESFDPGYHIELHPVYGHQIPPGAVPYSVLQDQLTPYMSRSAIRRLNSGKLGAPALLGIPHVVSPKYHPLPVHSRYRRSTNDESNAREQRDKLDKNDVATKSSLNENIPPVVDLQNQNAEATKNLEEKHVKVRQSDPNQATMTNTLLGLNPSNMHPVDSNQYYVMLKAAPNPTVSSYQQVVSEQIHPETLSGTKARAVVQEQVSSQNQAAMTTQATVPRINLENLQHAMLLQQTAPQQNGVSQTYEQRNFPDPRPEDIASQPKTETPNNHGNPQTPTAARHAKASNDEEIVGTKLGKIHKLTAVKHVHHHHPTFETSSYATGGSSGCCCGVQGGPSNNLQFAQNPTHQVVQVYQVPSVQGTNYPSSMQYVVLPQPSTSSPSSFSGCLQSPDTVPSVMYRLASIPI